MNIKCRPPLWAVAALALTGVLLAATAEAAGGGGGGGHGGISLGLGGGLGGGHGAMGIGAGRGFGAGNAGSILADAAISAAEATLASVRLACGAMELRARRLAARFRQPIRIWVWAPMPYQPSRPAGRHALTSPLNDPQRGTRAKRTQGDTTRRHDVTVPRLRLRSRRRSWSWSRPSNSTARQRP